MDSHQRILKLNTKQNVHKTNKLTKTKQHVLNNQINYKWKCIGVDNGFKRPTQILPCTFSKRLRRSARAWSQRISQKYTCVINTGWESGIRPLIILLLCAMIALMISVFIAAIITRLSWCLINLCCSSKVIAWLARICFVLLLVTGKLYWIHFWCKGYVVI